MSNKTLNPGDTVVCVDDAHQTTLKYGRKYTLQGVDKGLVTLFGMEGYFWIKRFELCAPDPSPVGRDGIGLDDHELTGNGLPDDEIEEPDMVNHPAHYTHAGIEVIDVIEAFDLNFRLANVTKYVLRADHKDDALEDLKKGAWYLAREIAKREEKLEGN